MASKDKNNNSRHKRDDSETGQGVPFQSAQDVWFWFIQAQQARIEGARFTAGLGAFPRPCEPIDILKILDWLYRKRRLLRDHLLVLRHYGRRAFAPDLRRVKEVRAHKLWTEALERLTPILERKGIVEKQSTFVPKGHWAQKELLLTGEGTL